MENKRAEAEKDAKAALSEQEAARAEREAVITAKMLVRKEAPMKPGQISVPEDKTTRFTNALTGVTGGVHGILRKRTRANSEGKSSSFTPYPHQRKCVKRALPSTVPRMLLCHDAGLGKTMTFLLMVAAMHTLQRGRRRKTIVSCPKSCLEQWYESLRDTLLIPKDRIIVSTKLKSLTRGALDHADFVITTKDLVGNAFGCCHAWETKHHQNERGNWCSGYARIPGVPLPPLLDTEFSMACIDEVHIDRNPDARWTRGHEMISQNTAKVIGMSATPLMNRPRDLCGIATGMDMPAKFKDIRSWFVDKKKTHVNLQTIRELAAITDRAKEEILNLPPLTDHYVEFDARMGRESVHDYNEILAKARKLRVSMEKHGANAAIHRPTQSAHCFFSFAPSPALERVVACFVYFCVFV